MWGMPKPPPQATWKKVEDDSVLRACTHRSFGFMSRGADGIWTAFDDDPNPSDHSPISVTEWPCSGLTTNPCILQRVPRSERQTGERRS